MDEPIENVAPSNVIINGTEYSPEDAQKLIELGNKTREYEQKWNSPIDSLASAYGKSQSELTQTRQEIEKYKAQIAKYESKQEQGTDTADDEAKAREAARKLGITLNEDLEKSGYVKKDDLENYLTEREQRANAARELNEQGKKLEEEINGEDGRPKFNYKMALAWAKAYNKNSLMEAYEDMHPEVKDWKKAQIEAKKNPSLKTFKPSGKKSGPEEKKVSDDNVKDLLKETLWGE